MTHPPGGQRRRRLRAVVMGSGLVATAAGLDTAVRGMRSIVGVDQPGSPEVESETRFYGGIYLGLGLSTLSLARRADEDPAGVRTLAVTVFLAGLARAKAWHDVGPPHPVQRALLAVELLGPPVLLAVQARGVTPAPEAAGRR